MAEDALDEFRQLILKVRSESISNVSGYLSGHYKGERAKAMLAAYKELESRPEVLVSYFLPEIIDEVIIILLQRLDESKFDLRRVGHEEGKDSLSLYEETDSLGAEYEFGWLNEVKRQAQS